MTKLDQHNICCQSYPVYRIVRYFVQ